MPVQAPAPARAPGPANEIAYLLNPAEIDELGEFVVVRILEKDTCARRVARELVERIAQEHPQAHALTAALLLTIAANGIEETLGAGDTAAAARDVWRMAALLAVDVLAMQRGSAGAHSAADLLRYWRKSDDFFLT